MLDSANPILLLPENPTVKRFLQKVSIPSDLDACWEWLACKGPRGYGEFCVEGRMYRAHRVAYLLFRGELSTELYVCHTCDNPGCVNPSHLWLGSALENNHDRDKKGRQVSPRGDRHGSRTKPETRAKGNRNGAYTKPDCVLCGDRHGMTKVADRDLPEVFRMRKEGKTLKEIASHFNVSFSLISKILLARHRKKQKANQIPAPIPDTQSQPNAG